jgi:LysR family transcriptional regulator, cell division regulator
MIEPIIQTDNLWGPSMDIADLKVFEAVARTGGMNRAAAELHTVQSNVTARIRALEAELGCSLFDRHSRGVALTAAGQRLLPYARRLAWLLTDAAQATRDDGQPRGPLTIGSLETTAALHLSPLFTRYAAACPEVDLAIRPGTTAELIEAVLDRRLEGAFVCGPVAHPAIAEEPVYQEELVILAAPGLTSIEHATLARIVVLRAGCSYRQRLEALLATRGIAVPRMMEFGTLEAIIGCVSAGLGITLLPRALVGPVWRSGRVSLHALPPHEAMVSTVFIRRREAHMSSALRAFLEQAKAQADQPIDYGDGNDQIKALPRPARSAVV